MAAEEKRFVSYAEINKLLGTSLQQSGFIAGEVGNYCSKNNLPFLNALIVSRNGFPGHDWYRWYSGKAQYKKEEAEISFCARCEKNEILLEIRDNGIGISPKDLPRITDKGYTGTTGRNYQKSTGMGLYLCKKLCSKLQLSFYIESKEEEYTKVTIGFPRNSMIFLNEE